MTLKLTTTVKKEVEYELRTLPYDQWPQEAKALARAVLLAPGAREEFRRTLEPLRKEWLVAKMEARHKAKRDIEGEFETWMGGGW